MTSANRGSSEEPQNQSSPRRVPPSFPNSPRPAQSGLPTGTPTRQTSNNPFHRAIAESQASSASLDKSDTSRPTSSVVDAMSPGSEVTPAMGSLTMSYAGATGNQNLTRNQSTDSSNPFKKPSSPSKPSPQAISNLIHSPLRSSPPPVFHGGKLVINRSSDHNRSGSTSSLQPSYAEGASRRVSSPAAAGASLSSEPMAREQGLGLNDGSDGSLPPSYIPGHSDRLHSTTGTSVNRMDVDRVEVVDPYMAMDQGSSGDERIEDTGRINHRPQRTGNQEGLDNADEEDERVNKGTAMFSPFNWNAYRNRYNQRLALAGQNDEEIAKAPEWLAPPQQPKYQDSSSKERWDNAIGHGISAYRLADQGPPSHDGHLIKAVSVKEDADGGDPHLKRLVSDLYSCFSNGEAYAWWYCYDCCVWFRLGVDYLEDNGLAMANAHNAAVSHESSDPQESLVGPDAGLASRLREKAGRQCTKHDQQHHFHLLQNILQLDIPPDALIKPNQSGQTKQAIVAEWSDILPSQTCSMYRCCQCDVVVYFDDYAAMPACFPESLLTKLRERPPWVGSSGNEYFRVLSLLLELTTKAIVNDPVEVDSEARPTDDATNPMEEGAVSKGDIRTIGMDDIGAELLSRAGFRSKFSSGKKLYYYSQNWKDRAWSLRAWTELKLLTERYSAPVLGPPQANLISSKFLHVFEANAILQAINRAAAKAMTQEKKTLYRVPRWTDPDPVSVNRLNSGFLRELTRQLGIRCDDTVEQIYQAFVAQVNCDPGSIMNCVQALRGIEANGTWDWDETDTFRTLFSLNSPHTVLMLGDEAPGLRYLEKIVVDSCSDARAAYDSRRLDMIAQISDAVNREKTKIESYESDVDKKEFQTALASAINRIAQIFRNPELEEMAYNLQDEFFALQTVAKKYSVDDPNQVDSEMWPSLYTIAMSEANNEESQKEVIKDFKLIATRLNVGSLQRELGMQTDEAANTPTKPVPAGLYNIGNTCYLNSLLQYLNTIEAFRDAIIALGRLDFETPSRDMLPRVGGRLLSQAELLRAKDFVQHLARLFMTLGTATDSAVAPERKLAYLALVTATDEKQSTAVPQDSVMSDTTTKDGLPKMDTSVTVDPVTESVLGKRTNDERESAEIIDNDREPHTPSTEPGESRAIKAFPISRGGSRSLSVEPVEPTVTSASNSPTKQLSGFVEEQRQDEPAPMDVDESALDTSSAVDPALVPLPGAALQAPPLPPRPHRASINNEMMFGRQHDISECLDNVLFQSEAVALAAKQGETGIVEDNTIKRLFFGISRQRLLAGLGQQANEANSLTEKSAQDVAFNSVYVSVRDEASSALYEKLQEVYFASDKVDLEDKTAYKVLEMQDIPPVLQIQLERAQFDRETARPYKSNAYVKFDETIYMDRFLPSADPAKRSQTQSLTRELIDARAKLTVLNGSKTGPIAQTMRDLAEALSGFPGDDERTLGLQATLKAESDRIDADIAATQKRIQDLLSSIEELWAESRDCAYELSSVFMHRGQAGFGHYWLYQRDLPNEPDEYLKFNDESVTRVDKSEVLGDMTGSNANPYLLVYVKKDRGMIRTHMRTPHIAQGQPELEHNAVISTSTDAPAPVVTVGEGGDIPAATQSTEQSLETGSKDPVGQQGRSN